jgi:type II secretion system protein I
MRRGFTLLEVLVAAIILTVGLLATLEVIAACAGTSRKVDERAGAMMAARSKLEEILKEPVLQIGMDQGKGVDTTTDFDWEANIEQSSNTGLLVITVRAEHRITHIDATLSALRRPDLQNTDTTGTDTTGTGTDTTGTGAAGAGAGGTL